MLMYKSNGKYYSAYALLAMQATVIAVCLSLYYVPDELRYDVWSSVSGRTVILVSG